MAFAHKRRRVTGGALGGISLVLSGVFTTYACWSMVVYVTIH